MCEHNCIIPFDFTSVDRVSDQNRTASAFDHGMVLFVFPYQDRAVNMLTNHFKDWRIKWATHI